MEERSLNNVVAENLIQDLTTIAADILDVIPDLASREVMPAIAHDMLMGTFSLLKKLLELGQVNPLAT